MISAHVWQIHDWQIIKHVQLVPLAKQVYQTEVADRCTVGSPVGMTNGWQELFFFTSLCAEKKTYDELPLPNSPGPGTQSAHEQFVRGPGRRPGHAHEQSVFCGCGRCPEHLHAL